MHKPQPDELKQAVNKVKMRQRSAAANAFPTNCSCFFMPLPCRLSSGESLQVLYAEAKDNMAERLMPFHLITRAMMKNGSCG